MFPFLFLNFFARYFLSTHDRYNSFGVLGDWDIRVYEGTDIPRRRRDAKLWDVRTGRLGTDGVFRVSFYSFGYSFTVIRDSQTVQSYLGMR